ncbi:MAG: 50S ribosomal protein L23 [Alphaproteobacteria bacterium]|nr:50S ribosomal protein L23 [Alphaproteobacteria bacterium]
MSAAKKKAVVASDLAPHYAIIQSPVITEKATNGSMHNQVTFRVLRTATKPQIRAAVENVFKVKVTAVNTHNRQGKTKRFKGRVGFRSDVKFAIVTLAEGSKIDVTTGL